MHRNNGPRRLALRQERQGFPRPRAREVSKSLFTAVNAGATLFSVLKQGAQVRLKHGNKSGGVLDVLAVPVSSLYA